MIGRIGIFSVSKKYCFVALRNIVIWPWAFFGLPRFWFLSLFCWVLGFWDFCRVEVGDLIDLRKGNGLDDFLDIYNLLFRIEVEGWGI